MKLPRCVIIYRTHLLGLLGDKEKMEGWKDSEAVAASVNTHHANSTVIYWESCQRGGQMTFTHSYQWKISLDRDFFITSLFAPGPSQHVCVQACMCVCCCVKVTLSWASRQTNTPLYSLVPVVCLYRCAAQSSEILHGIMQKSLIAPHFLIFCTESRKHSDLQTQMEPQSEKNVFILF